MEIKKIKKNDQFYIVRAARAGVFFGKIKEKSAGSVIMTDVRKLWYWDGAAAVEQIAVDGVRAPENCKFTVSVPAMEIMEPVQIIPCTKKAAGIIKAVREWKM